MVIAQTATTYATTSTPHSTAEVRTAPVLTSPSPPAVSARFDETPAAIVAISRNSRPASAVM